MKLQDVLQYDDIPFDLQDEARKIVLSFAERANTNGQPPVLIHLCGIPGSGKSTYARILRENRPELTILAFDDVMAHFSGYRLAKEEISIEEAFAKWELPARIVGYHILEALFTQKKSIVFDHSAADRAHLELISYAKNLGYSVEMHYLSCDPLLALKRVKAREQAINRHTPVQLIWDRDRLLRLLVQEYQQRVDFFYDVHATLKQGGDS